MGQWVTTRRSCWYQLLAAPASEAARGSQLRLSRHDQIFQPHAGEPVKPGLTRMHRGDGQTSHPPGLLPLRAGVRAPRPPAFTLPFPALPAPLPGSLPLGLGSPSVSS